MVLTLTKTILLLISLYGWYALYIFGYKNGSLSMVSTQRESGRLGDTSVTYNESFTGIPRIDQHLNVLLTFFWPLVDGSRPDASLHSFYFAGQGIAVWVATVIEGLRRGNKWHTISLYVNPTLPKEHKQLTGIVPPHSVSCSKPSEWR